MKALFNLISFCCLSFFVSAQEYKTPVCSGCQNINPPQPVRPTSIGITRVILADIDTSTALFSPVYHDLHLVKQAKVYRGVCYTLQTFRLQPEDPMTTKAWIDFDANIQFNESERILFDSSSTKTQTSVTFTIPVDASVGHTRMRVGVTYGTTTLNDSVATLGCFEDYGVTIGWDSIKPAIRLSGSDTENVEVNTAYIEKGIKAIDNLEGDISSRYQYIGQVDTHTPGVYTLTYWISDSYGNTDTVTRTIMVYALPHLILSGSDTIMIGVFNRYIDSGATAITSTGMDITSQILQTGTVDTTKIGTYLITYAVMETPGFWVCKQRVVMVADTLKPILSLLGDNPFIVDVYSEYVDPGVLVTDNYTQNIIVQNIGLPNMKSIGEYIITYTAKDESGNTSTLFRKINVVDRIAPTIELVGAKVMELCSGQPFVEPGVMITDNFYADSLLQKLLKIDMSNVDFSNPGTYTITYSVKDFFGNQSLPVTRMLLLTKCPIGGIGDNYHVQSITVFPNPTKGLVNITNPANTNFSYINVKDVTGRIVYVESLNNRSVQIDFSSLKKGFYAVVLKDENGVNYSSKILIE